MKRSSESICIYCTAPEDTTEHIIFDCDYWVEDQEWFEDQTDRVLAPNDVDTILYGPPIGELSEEGDRASRIVDYAKWMQQQLITMVVNIMSLKEEDERQM